MATLSSDQRENHIWQNPDRSRRASSDIKGSDIVATRSIAGDRLSQLTRTIESQIIPRLLLANSTMPGICGRTATEASVPVDAVEDLATTTARNDLVRAKEIVALQQASGVSLASVFLELLAPTARRLGRAWETDEMSFAEVSIGLGVLQQLLRELSPAFESRRGPAPSCHRALLLTAQGEQHAFGLFIVESFFRRAGWDVITHASLPHKTVFETLRHEWFDVVAISKSCDGLLDELASDITTFRRISRNRMLTVMVGGAAFARHPEHVTVVGADTTANDGDNAVWQATECMKAKRARRKG